MPLYTSIGRISIPFAVFREGSGVHKFIKLFRTLFLIYIAVCLTYLTFVRQGITVEQYVFDFGDSCQVTTYFVKWRGGAGQWNGGRSVMVDKRIVEQVKEQEYNQLKKILK